MRALDEVINTLMHTAHSSDAGADSDKLIVMCNALVWGIRTARTTIALEQKMRDDGTDLGALLHTLCNAWDGQNFLSGALHSANRADLDTQAYPADFKALLDADFIETCPHCGKFNSWQWIYTNMRNGVRLINSDGFADGGEIYTDEEIHADWPDVYPSYQSSRLGGHSCGNCHTFID